MTTCEKCGTEQGIFLYCVPSDSGECIIIESTVVGLAYNWNN